MAGAGDGREPNLELPSFFGRRRKKGQPDAAADPVEAAEPSRSEPAGPVEPATPSDPTPTTGLRPAARAKRVPPPRRRPAPEAPPETQPLAAARAAEPAETAPPPPSPPSAAPAPAPAARRTPPPPPAEAPAAPAARAAEPAAAPAPVPAAPEPASNRGPEMSYPDDEPTTVLTAPRPDDTRTEGAEDPVEGPEDEGRRPRRRPSVRLPQVGAVPAAALSGAVAALAGVGLGWLALQGCEVVRGVSTCGGGPGLLALLVVVVLEVLIGAALLRAFGSVQATGTSLVGVGLVVVVAMLAFPASAVTTLAAVVVLPLATAVTFVLAHVMATTVVETESHHR